MKPFDRLQFWTVPHTLIHRLEPYQVNAKPSMIREASWSTLVYWSRLFETVEQDEPAPFDMDPSYR